MRFSIVTPSFNQARYLGETGRSVLSQTGVDLEWLVIDGGSTDGTLDYLQSLTDPRIRWISEKDQGQSHAINKGLAMATGDVVAWLNSDDVYADHALSRVAQALAAHPDRLWAFGRCDVIDETGQEIRHKVTAYKDFYLRRYTYRQHLRENFVSQPAVFWRRAASEQLDESLHYTMDYDLWLRLGGKSPPVFIDQVLAHFRFHGGSKSGAVNRAQFDEEYAVAMRYFNGDVTSALVHRFNVEKIVWAYRLMRLLGK